MKLTLFVRPWKDDHQADPEDATILFVDGYAVDDQYLSGRVGELILVRGDALLRINSGGDGDFAQLEVTDVDPDWFSALDPNSYAMGSSAKRASLIVSAIEVKLLEPDMA